MTIGAKGTLSKLRAGPTYRQSSGCRGRRGIEWFQACGELSTAQLDDPDKLKHTLCRVVLVSS